MRPLWLVTRNWSSCYMCVLASVEGASNDHHCINYCRAGVRRAFVHDIIWSLGAATSQGRQICNRYRLGILWTRCQVPNQQCKSIEGTQSTDSDQWPGLILISPITGLLKGRWCQCLLLASKIDVFLQRTFAFNSTVFLSSLLFAKEDIVSFQQTFWKLAMWHMSLQQVYLGFLHYSRCTLDFYTAVGLPVVACVFASLIINDGKWSVVKCQHSRRCWQIHKRHLVWHQIQVKLGFIADSNTTILTFTDIHTNTHTHTLAKWLWVC